MASTEHEPITGVWGRAPIGVQGQSPWSGGQGAKPPEAESFLRIGHSKEGQTGLMSLNDRNCNFWKGALWGGEGDHLGCSIQKLDSNETGGLIVMNVIWSHFLFDTPQKTAS